MTTGFIDASRVDVESKKLVFLDRVGRRSAGPIRRAPARAARGEVRVCHVLPRVSTVSRRARAARTAMGPRARVRARAPCCRAARTPPIRSTRATRRRRRPRPRARAATAASSTSFRSSGARATSASASASSATLRASVAGSTPTCGISSQAGSSRSRARTQGFQVPFQDLYFKITIPRFLGSGLQLELRPAYTWEETLGYFGMGNASSAAKPPGAKDSFNWYGRLHPALDLQLRWRLADHIAGARGGALHAELAPDQRGIEARARHQVRKPGGQEAHRADEPRRRRSLQLRRAVGQPRQRSVRALGLVRRGAHQAEPGRDRGLSRIATRRAAWWRASTSLSGAITSRWRCAGWGTSCSAIPRSTSSPASTTRTPSAAPTACEASPGSGTTAR